MQYADPKAPGEVLEYTHNWAVELGSGETISTSTWSVETGLTRDSVSNTGTTATVWLSGGTGGVEYECENTIETSAGRTHVHTVIVPVLVD